MSQSVVTIRINGTPYQMGCDAGQEAHVEELGRQVDQIVTSLSGQVGQIGEARLLAMASLILADHLHQARQNPAAAAAGTLSDGDADQLAQTIEKLAQEIKTLASAGSPT